MIRAAAWLWLVGAALSACTTAGPRAAGAPDAAASFDAPLLEPPAELERLIVWGRSKRAATEESYWLEWHPPTLETLGRRAGALFWANGGVYRFQETIGKSHTLIDCGEAFDPGQQPNPRNHVEVEVKGAVAERLDARDEIVISALEELDGYSRYENGFDLLASFGSRLYIEAYVDQVHCTAAHGGTSRYHSLYEAATRKSLPYPTKQDEAALFSAAEKLGPAELEPCLAIAEQTDGVGLRGLSLDSAVLKWSEERGLFTTVGLSFIRTYVEGMTTCSLDVPGVSPSLGDVRVPRALSALRRTLPDLEVMGWSLVPNDAPSAHALKQAFAQAKSAADGR